MRVSTHWNGLDIAAGKKLCFSQGRGESAEERSSRFCRGSTTFREAYERTGRILNVSCVPSDPHSPTSKMSF